MRYKTLLKLICIFLISITACVFCIQSSHYKSYTVPGTVISKDTEQYTHGKHRRNMSTRYIMCVKPNDTHKFKHYSLYVDYTTYCTHNLGDKITFSVSENEEASQVNQDAMKRYLVYYNQLFNNLNLISQVL